MRERPSFTLFLEADEMPCQFDGKRCDGIVPCYRCGRNPYPSGWVKYPSERTVFVASLRGFLS